MAHKKMKLGDLCSVMTGAPMSRAKKLSDGETGTEVKVLVPRAMEGGRIVDDEIVYEIVSKVKEGLFTKEGDVVVKVSTPYDCVYIDKPHEGILVTSFGLILRAKAKSGVDMRYLATYLNQPQAGEMLQALSKGVALRLIKRKDMTDLEIPVVSKAQQSKLAALFVNTQKRKEQCLQLMKKSDELLEAEFCRIVFD